MTITRDWLQQKIAAMEEARDEIPIGLDEDERNTLEALLIALASLEAEPAGYMNKFTGRVYSLEEQPGADTDTQVYAPIYTAPPALASLDAEPVAWRWSYGGGTNWRLQDSEPSIGDNKKCPRVINPLYTAPPAPVVPDEMTIADVIMEIDAKDADRWTGRIGFQKGWNACRAAMQGKADSPVADGWVACSERMPDEDGNYWGWWSESNRQGPVWFIKSDLQAQFQSSEITHWMPLPAAPQQEVKP